MTSVAKHSAPSLSKDSPVMLAALGILAYAASMMTHEALGHGAFCVAMGGHNVALSAWNEDCSTNPHGIEAAGPIVQFGAGLLTWSILHRLPPAAARLRFFLWLYMGFNLFIASSYIAFGGITGFGDAAVVISRLQPHAVWRGVLIALGSFLYLLSMLAAALELKRFAGLDPARRLFRLVWIPYVAAAILACSAGALNRTMGHGVALGYAVASSFGSAMGMLWLPDVQRGLPAITPPPSVYLTWSAVWTLAAVVIVLAFLCFLGPGMKY
jgi:hypothetical protein